MWESMRANAEQVTVSHEKLNSSVEALIDPETEATYVKFLKDMNPSLVLDQLNDKYGVWEYEAEDLKMMFQSMEYLYTDKDDKAIRSWINGEKDLWELWLTDDVYAIMRLLENGDRDSVKPIIKLAINTVWSWSKVVDKITKLSINMFDWSFRKLLSWTSFLINNRANLESMWLWITKWRLWDLFSRMTSLMFGWSAGDTLESIWLIWVEIHWLVWTMGNSLVHKWIIKKMWKKVDTQVIDSENDILTRRTYEMYNDFLHVSKTFRRLNKKANGITSIVKIFQPE